MISEQPTVVLLHGAGAGAWIWQRVLDKLRVPGVALDVPGRPLELPPDSCAAELVRALPEPGGCGNRICRMLPTSSSFRIEASHRLART
jgi:pimeloyl-ACP methyl ester carboxylesterase